MRQMVWIKTARMEAWACSECAWAFSPSGPPRGSSIEEMKENFERQRDKEYASHVCAEHPRAKSAREDARLPQ
jgi:rubredoxin